MSEITMQQLKEQRLTPAEKFVLGKVKSAKPIEPHENGDVWWVSDGGEWLFGQKLEYSHLNVSWDYVWSVLEEKYNLSIEEIKQLLTKLLYKYTNNGQLEVAIANVYRI